MEYHRCILLLFFGLVNSKIHFVELAFTINGTFFATNDVPFHIINLLKLGVLGMHTSLSCLCMLPSCLCRHVEMVINCLKSFLNHAEGCETRISSRKYIYLSLCVKSLIGHANLEYVICYLITEVADLC